MKLYDLTGELANGMWDYGEPFIPFDVKRITSMEEDGYVASVVTMTTHTGTHMDCARHFGEERKAIHEIDLSRFIGPARLIDVTKVCEKHAPITREMLKSAGGEELQPEEICVMYTGWDKEWGCEGYVDNYPYLSVDGAEYLIEKGIKMIATDIPIIGDPHGTDTDMVFCREEIPSVFSLVNLSKLPKQFTFAAFPLKIEAGDGSPVRAVAWE